MKLTTKSVWFIRVYVRIMNIFTRLNYELINPFWNESIMGSLWVTISTCHHELQIFNFVSFFRGWEDDHNNRSLRNQSWYFLTQHYITSENYITPIKCTCWSYIPMTGYTMALWVRFLSFFVWHDYVSLLCDPSLVVRSATICQIDRSIWSEYWAMRCLHITQFNGNMTWIDNHMRYILWHVTTHPCFISTVF